MASRPSGANAGVIRLGAKFSTLSRSVSAAELVKALRLGGLIIAKEAKIRAPVLSGQLRRSIAVSTSTSGGKAEARVGSNLEYARRLEFGFTGTDRLGRAIDQPGQPFLRPAAKAKSKEVIKEISRAIAAKIKSAI